MARIYNEISLAPGNGRGSAGSCHGVIAARKHPQSVVGEASSKRVAKSRRQLPPGERFSLLDYAGWKYWVSLVVFPLLGWAVTL